MFRQFVRALLLLLPFAFAPQVQADPPKKTLGVPPLFRDVEAPRPLPRLEVTDTLRKPASPSVIPTKDDGKSYELFVVARSERIAPAGGMVGIGFINHSDRDIVLKFNSRTVRLPSRHSMQVKMPREFSWRELEGNEQKTKVPVDADGVEIVFKK